MNILIFTYLYIILFIFKFRFFFRYQIPEQSERINSNKCSINYSRCLLVWDYFLRNFATITQRRRVFVTRSTEHGNPVTYVHKFPSLCLFLDGNLHPCDSHIRNLLKDWNAWGFPNVDLPNLTYTFIWNKFGTALNKTLIENSPENKKLIVIVDFPENKS